MIAHIANIVQDRLYQSDYSMTVAMQAAQSSTTRERALPKDWRVHSIRHYPMGNMFHAYAGNLDSTASVD